MSENSSTDLNSKCHVVFLHNRLRKRPDDRYMVDLAIGLKEYGHDITILTSQHDPADCCPEVNPVAGTIQVKYCARFVPKNWFVLRAIIMALRLCFFPPKPKPKVVILDVHPIAAFILSKLTRYKTIFLTHFSAIKELDFYSNYLKVTPDLFTAKTIRYANEVVVANECLGHIFRRSFPNYHKELKYLSPCVDTGLWASECIDVKRIIPDLPSNACVFVVFGPYRRRSNFKLALDAFETLILISEEPLKDKYHLVLAGKCSDRTMDDQIYYDELLDMMKDKTFGSQVTFLKQLPTVHKKSLLRKCTALLLPSKHDPFPDSVIEALSMGRPIIATNTGYAKVILTHRISGILLEADPQKFAAAMYKVVVNPMVQLFISEMATDIFKNQFSFDCMSRKINNLVMKYAEPSQAVEKNEIS